MCDRSKSGHIFQRESGWSGCMPQKKKASRVRLALYSAMPFFFPPCVFFYSNAIFKIHVLTRYFCSIPPLLILRDVGIKAFGGSFPFPCH